MASSQAFDEKNQADFDENTRLITESIFKIAENKKLKPTIAELSRLTGIHRNTIRQRGWPVGRLNSIKEERRREYEKKKLDTGVGKDPLKVLDEKLEKSRLEVIYWFNKARDHEESYLSLEKQYLLMRDSRDTYLKLHEDSQNKVLELKREVDKLRTAISLLEAETLEKKP